MRTENEVKQVNIDSMTVSDKKSLMLDIIYMSIALVFLFAGLIYKQIFKKQDVILTFIYLTAIVIIGLPVLIKAVKGLIKKDLSAAMEILVSIAIIGCVVSNQYIVGILIPVILTFVHFLEEKSLLGGKDAIEALMKMQSHTAVLLKDGNETEVPVSVLKKGDIITVKPGMAVPVDGVVIDGISNINQQSLTGEADLVFVKKGGLVFEGMINVDGTLIVQVEKEHKDTSFRRIINLLKETQKTTVSETRIIDKFILYYIPLVIIIAVFAWLFSKDISRAIAVLVVSCPCGYMVVVSAPMLVAFSVSAQKGILVKGAAFIEKLCFIKNVIFDKTGTLTKATSELVSYELYKAKSFDELISVAAVAAFHSVHPVSGSIVRLCKTDFDKSYLITENIGYGIIALKKSESDSADEDCDRVVIGNSKFLLKLGYDITATDDQSCTWVAHNNEILGCLFFDDTVRDDALEAVQLIRETGIKKISILSGDKETSTSKIKEQLNIDEEYSEVLPDDKLNVVRQAREEGAVLFVGDGINDALALAEADVGIAMGAMGSDIAIQSADIALTNNSLKNIPFIIELAKKTKKIIMQNIAIAFVSSFIMILLAATGVVSPLLGAVLHNIGAFIVIINSGQLYRKNKKQNSPIPV